VIFRGALKVLGSNSPGKSKVDGQWKLVCMMHNIEKLAHHGYAQ
jgi:hypothetical protein